MGAARRYARWPFGRRVVVHRDAGVLLCVTIVGIPFGVASFAMAGLALVPLGARVVEGDRDEVPGYRVAAAA